MVILVLGVAVLVVLAVVAGFAVTYRRLASSTPPGATGPACSPSPTAIPSALPSPVVDPGVDGLTQLEAARLLAQIEQQVAALRALQPRSEVPLNFLNEAEAEAFLRERYGEGDLEASLRPYVAVGLLPEAWPSVEVRELVGLYAADEEQLYVVMGGWGGGADDQALLAYAYAHALQDQNFGLTELDARAASSDAELALRGLAEGDATLLTALYRYGELAAVDWEHVESLLVRAQQPGVGGVLEGDRAWVRLRRFPFREGRRFVEAAYASGGWQAVDRIYADPPRSTEQVLHPERYIEQRDLPTVLAVPDLAGVLGGGWKLTFEDTMGEFVLGLYLEQVLSDALAWRAVDGWDGDRFVVWEGEGGGQVWVWRTVWDSTGEAEEFERALAASVPQRYVPSRPAEPPPGLVGQWWETSMEVVHVSRVARHVVLVGAPDVETLASVVDALP